MTEPPVPPPKPPPLRTIEDKAPELVIVAAVLFMVAVVVLSLWGFYGIHEYVHTVVGCCK